MTEADQAVGGPRNTKESSSHSGMMACGNGEHTSFDRGIMSEVEPGVDHHGPRSEVLSLGDPYATRSRRWVLPIGATALAGLAAVSLLVRPAQQSVPKPTPTHHVTAPSEPVTNFSPLPIAEGNPYFRSAPEYGTSIVAFLLTNTSLQPIFLSSVQVVGTNIHLAAAIVPIDWVRRLMLAGGSVDPSVFSPAIQMPTIQVGRGKSAGLVISVEPNCAVRQASPTSVVTVVGSRHSPAGNVPASYTLPEPIDGSMSPAWLQRAVAAICTPPPSRSSNIAIVTKRSADCG